MKEADSFFMSQFAGIYQDIGDFSCFVFASLQVRALFFIKHVGHSVNLVQ